MKNSPKRTSTHAPRLCPLLQTPVVSTIRVTKTNHFGSFLLKNKSQIRKQIKDSITEITGRNKPRRFWEPRRRRFRT